MRKIFRLSLKKAANLDVENAAYNDTDWVLGQMQRMRNPGTLQMVDAAIIKIR